MPVEYDKMKIRNKGEVSHAKALDDLVTPCK
jgi:hypothetical protein